MILRLTIVVLLVTLSIVSICADISTENILNSKRSWETCTAEGTRARLSGKLDESITWYKRSIEHADRLPSKDPMHTMSNLNLGSVLLQNHQFKEAEQCF